MKLPYFLDWLLNFKSYKLEPIKPEIDMKLYNKYKNYLDKANINTTLRLSHFFAQMKQESGLVPKRESLNYSVEALIRMFGRHRISIEEANRYGRKPGQKANQVVLANILYGGEWGRKNLGNTQPNDGWYFRGGGLKQITGRYNITKLSIDTGIDFVGNPDLLVNEQESMIAAIWFWTENRLNRIADTDNVKAVTKVVNGGYNGLDKRTQFTNEFKTIFKNV